MRILYAGGLHGGEWTTFRAQALKDLQTNGRITNLFPKNHNGDWMWSQVLSQMGHQVLQFNYRLSYLIDNITLVKWRGLKPSYDEVLRRWPWLSRLDQKRMNRELLSFAKRKKRVGKV